MLKLYNTLTRKKENFKPLKGKEVKIYSCGPTVYNKVHIGNLRAFVFTDLLRRYLKAKGFKVKQVMNITDVDDKTIRGSCEEKVSLGEFTKKYTELFFNDLKELNIEKVEFYPRATENIKEIVSLVQSLIENGNAYKTNDGIYFDISSFKNYGNLSKLDLKQLKTGASGRVNADEYDKQNPQDFALWKFWTESDGDVFWKTQIGKGRPGWHIECSAMSTKYLGQPFDIHTGGVDLIFPHHENEIAQSESASGKKLANFWMHNEHLLVDGKKMSKSLGNFYTLDDLKAKGFDAVDVRYLLLATHYRQKLNLNDKSLLQAKESVKRINEFVLNSQGDDESNGDISELIKNSEKEFEKAMDNDLDVSKGLAVIFNFIKECNKLGGGKTAGEFIKKMNRILGILREEEQTPEEVKKLAEEREKARKEKDWGKSDELRNQIVGLGWEVRDTQEGFVLRRL